MWSDSSLAEIARPKMEERKKVASMHGGGELCQSRRSSVDTMSLRSAPTERQCSNLSKPDLARSMQIR
ncbi:hypothetical protein TIFTF001_048104 [Ficus carica]|uniref:Uncharacterized protein n=1 Tax=Ficus carica TaxID=3494 RepID=A0AA87ZAU0_FICCA|nr:hypothetical protein TIFTF001_048104 [Ficus carica]